MSADSTHPNAAAPGSGAALRDRLLNDFQRDFPLVERPFAAIADRLGCDEAAVLAQLRAALEEGLVGRVGAVLAPHSVGASTLAALAAPADRLEAVARCVSAEPGVNHNYEREDALNLWFVVHAAGEAQLEARLRRIAAQTGLTVHDLRLEREYRIDLGFDLTAPHLRGLCRAAAALAPDPRRLSPAPAPLADGDRALLARVAEGLPLAPRPFAALAAELGLDEERLRERLHAWCDEGRIRRFGVVVRHREAGLRANAMVVWDLPEADADRIGAQMARFPFVTLCYRRRRSPPAWPFNLYCMIHGTQRRLVDAQIAQLVRELGLDAQPRRVLYSRRCFVQRGAPVTEAAP